MKNVLVIVANPKKDSLSFAIANTYKEKSEEMLFILNRQMR